MRILLIAAAVATLATACTPSVDADLDTAGHSVNMYPMYLMALMDSMAYESDSAIAAYYGDELLAIGEQPGWDGKFFVLIDREAGDLAIAENRKPRAA